MPARRKDLKLMATPKGRDPAATDAKIGGLGLDFDAVPAILDEVGRAEWQRLATVFKKDPVRFREGDRSAVTAYCLWHAVFEAAMRQLQAGEGSRAVEARVKEASQQLRAWSRELGLTPDARGKMGISDDDPDADDDDIFSGKKAGS